jgi:hypothetical protein
MGPGVAGAAGFTTIGIALLVAGVGPTQGALEVITTDTLLPFVSELVVNVADVAPTTLVPLILHW